MEQEFLPPGRCGFFHRHFFRGSAHRLQQFHRRTAAHRTTRIGLRRGLA